MTGVFEQQLLNGASRLHTDFTAQFTTQTFLHLLQVDSDNNSLIERAELRAAVARRLGKGTRTHSILSMRPHSIWLLSPGAWAKAPLISYRMCSPY